MIVCANVQTEQFYCSLRNIALILTQTKQVFTGFALPCNDTVEMTSHVDTGVKRGSKPREHLPKKTKRYINAWI